MVDYYSVSNYSPFNTYLNYGYNNYPMFTGNDPKYGIDTLSNTNYLQTQSNLKSDVVDFSANKQIQVDQQKQQKQLSTGAKIAIGAGIATVVAVGADFLFCKGKHVKSLFRKNTPKSPNNGTKPNNTTNTIPTSQQTKSSPNHSSSQTAPANNVNVSSNVSTDKMREYIAKKYSTGIDYSSRPCGNYADAIYRNYLGIRTCPKDYYSMNKSYDVNRLFDVSSKGRKGICVDDNDGMGWFYRQATKNLQTGQAQPKVVERISLNVYPDENLIKALDDFIIRTNVNVEYKVPQVFNDWLTRHDPITMYFREDIPKSVKDQVIRIVTPYIRKSPKGEVMLGTKLAEGVYQIPNPTEQDVLNLIKRAKKLGDDKLVECLESTAHVVNGGAGLYSYSHHSKPVVKASAGQFKAAEMLIEDLERFQKSAV